MSISSSCASAVDNLASFYWRHVGAVAAGQPDTVCVGLGGPGSGPPHGAAQMAAHVSVVGIGERGLHS